jgi:hypothetical protein
MVKGGDKMLDHPIDNTNMKITTIIFLHKIKWRKP